jgi:uncharacterized membrane protein YhaH (DUF805 family)
MSFTEAVRSCLRQYATFSGRARRSEYWWFNLAAGLVMLLIAVVVFTANGVSTDAAGGDSQDASALMILIFLVVYVALIIPGLAVFVRRMHDIGRSGWWWLLGFIPFGSLVLLVFTCLDSRPDNQYGPSPKASLPGAGWN